MNDAVHLTAVVGSPRSCLTARHFKECLTGVAAAGQIDDVVLGGAP